MSDISVYRTIFHFITYIDKALLLISFREKAPFFVQIEAKFRKGAKYTKKRTKERCDSKILK